MKKWSLVLFTLLMIFLAGCSTERLAPDVFIKKSWTTTYQMDYEQMGQKTIISATLQLDPTERQRLLSTLPYDSPMRQMPFGIFLQTDLSANLEMDFQMSKKSMQFAGDMVGSVDLGMMTQQFPMQIFLDLSGSDGGTFFAFGRGASVWQILSPFSAFQASLEDMNIENTEILWNWEEYKKSLSKEEQKFVDAAEKAFFKHLTITTDETNDSIRTIEGDLQVNAFLEEVMIPYLENDEFKKSDQFLALDSTTAQQFEQNWLENKEEVIEGIKTYTQGIQVSLKWVANEKTKELQELDWSFKIGADAEVMKQLSSLIQLDEPIHPIISLETHSELYKVSKPRAIRPESLTQEQQQYLVEEDRQERTVLVKTSLEQLNESIVEYYELNSKLPENLTMLSESIDHEITLTDMFSLKTFGYEVTTNSYKVYSVGPDGKKNTEDDIILSKSLDI